LDGKKWDAAAYLSPLYAIEALKAFKRARKSTKASFVSEAQAGSGQARYYLRLGYLGYLIRQWFWWTHRVWFLAFLTAQIDSQAWSWWVPAVPIISAMVFGFFLKFKDDKVAQAQAGESADGNSAEDQANAKTWATFTTVLSCLMFSLAMIFMGLLVTHLDKDHYTMAAVFIPIFIIFGFLVCCCFCCVPLICCCMRGGGEEGQNQNPLNNIPEFMSPGRSKRLLLGAAPTSSSSSSSSSSSAPSSSAPHLPQSHSASPLLPDDLIPNDQDQDQDQDQDHHSSDSSSSSSPPIVITIPPLPP
jgi:hypothetical protein